MCDNWRGCAENWRKESLASNQVVGGSNRSGRTIFSMIYDAPETQKFLENSDLQGSNRWLGNYRRECLHQ